MLVEAGLQGLSLGVALGSALWAGGVAASKNRNIALWALIGLLLSLVGVVIALCMAPKPPKHHRERVEELTRARARPAPEAYSA